MQTLFYLGEKVPGKTTGNEHSFGETNVCSVYFSAGSLCYCLHALFFRGLDFVGVECVWLETFAAGDLRGFARVAANKKPVTLVCVELKLEKCKVMITASSL